MRYFSSVVTKPYKNSQPYFGGGMAVLCLMAADISNTHQDYAEVVFNY